MSNATLNFDVSQDWDETPTYKLRVLLFKEEDGTISVIAMNLPGVVGCGDSEEEALESLKAGFRGVLEVCREEGIEIPWGEKSTANLPFGKEKSIYVNG